MTTHYPVQFNQCPNCGGEKRVVEEEVKAEIEAGRLAKGSKAPAMVSRTQIFNAKEPGLLVKKEIPVLMGFYDVCADCGTLYLLEMQRHTAIVEPVLMKPLDDFPPGLFGKG